MADVKERFWRGTIQSRAHAEKVVGYAAGTFAVFAGLFALTLFQGVTTAKVLTALIFAAPALALQRSKGAIPAGILLGMSALSFAGSIAASIYAATGGNEPGLAVGILVVGVFWLVLGYVAWRGFVAARYLRSNSTANVMA